VPVILSEGKDLLVQGLGSPHARAVSTEGTAGPRENPGTLFCVAVRKVIRASRFARTQILQGKYLRHPPTALKSILWLAAKRWGVDE
jgi:hypothetical protein